MVLQFPAYQGKLVVIYLRDTNNCHYNFKSLNSSPLTYAVSNLHFHIQEIFIFSEIINLTQIGFFSLFQAKQSIYVWYVCVCVKEQAPVHYQDWENNPAIAPLMMRDTCHLCTWKSVTHSLRQRSISFDGNMIQKNEQTEKR